MRNITLMDTVKFKIKQLNKYLNEFEQRIELSEQELNSSNEIYWNITWYRPIDKYTEAKEHIFGGDDLELFATLTGIEYGIRMQRYKI